jgi:hypothetical protein
VISVSAALLLACGRPSLEVPVPAARPTGWLKGQTHAHSSGSGDSRTPAGEVAAWYAARGYDFLVLTDHEYVSTPRWDGPMLLVPGIELTQNLASCSPPADGGCHIHVNGLFVDPALRNVKLADAPADPPDRLERYASAVDRAHAMGGIAQINHPNWGWMADGAMLAALGARGAELVEIANESGVDDAGDAAHPSTEAQWDAALTAGSRLWGVASDDAHHYADADALEAKGEPAYRGDRGWVMVRADRDPASIRAALVAGEFYASTGVMLSRYDVGADAIGLAVVGDPVDFVFVGAGGRELGREHGTEARFELANADRYVRVDVIGGDGRRAWTQPVFTP